MHLTINVKNTFQVNKIKEIIFTQKQVNWTAKVKNQSFHVLLKCGL